MQKASDMKTKILDSDSWPQWPKLPMKKRQKVGMPAIGYLFCDVQMGGPVKLYRGNIFSDVDADKFDTFESIDALLAAGWEVD